MQRIASSALVILGWAFLALALAGFGPAAVCALVGLAVRSWGLWIRNGMRVARRGHRWPPVRRGKATVARGRHARL